MTLQAAVCLCWCLCWCWCWLGSGQAQAVDVVAGRSLASRACSLPPSGRGQQVNTHARMPFHSHLLSTQYTHTLTHSTLHSPTHARIPYPALPTLFLFFLFLHGKLARSPKQQLAKATSASNHGTRNMDD
ncbi:hypothetical protein DM02DRAFT_630474 [Periconia macrospinosa]|uniref:Secreted protein n=1 Tax=Periconia macrospinosa TaxID=97972 RepID=A0A2V1DJ78_9PLEO|nr:hypothetical protein DM02DRAFT_630474 [Periconia macrospinosa]